MKAVLVKWRDIINFGLDWSNLEDTMDAKPPVVFTLGFIVKHDRDVLQLTANYYKDEDGVMGGPYIVIPVEALIDIQYLDTDESFNA